VVTKVEILYYPGCSLKNTYPEFDRSMYEVCDELGIKLLEIPDWQCCGVNYNLAKDNIMRHLGAIRSLIHAQETGREKGISTVTAVCSMCYNVLKRVNLTLKEDPETLENVNVFIKDQPDYVPSLNVRHILTLFSEVGSGKIEERVKRPLHGLNVAAYYGCALLRPNRPVELPIDNSEHPTIFENLVRALGTTATEFPYKAECCGNYHVVNNPNIVEMRTKKIIKSARAGNADIIISSCPLCTFNLEYGNQASERNERVPVVFFTQLMALAFGMETHLPKDLENSLLEEIE
jgi:heterodisulfide reductase subunit B